MIRDQNNWSFRKRFPVKQGIFFEDKESSFGDSHGDFRSLIPYEFNIPRENKIWTKILQFSNIKSDFVPPKHVTAKTQKDVN